MKMCCQTDWEEQQATEANVETDFDAGDAKGVCIIKGGALPAAAVATDSCCA